MKRVISTTVAGLILLFGAGGALAADNWEVPLKVRVDRAENQLAFGAHAEATAGFDGRFDVPVMSGGNLQAFFTAGGKQVWRSLVASPGVGSSWVLTVSSSLTGKSVNLEWAQNQLPGNCQVRLTDLATNENIDMRQQAQYVYVNQGVRKFAINVY